MPTKAWVRLSALEGLHADRTHAVSYGKEEREAAVALCQQEAEWCWLKEKRLTKALQQMKQRYVHYQRALQQATQQHAQSKAGAEQKIIISELSYLQLQLEKRSLKNQLKCQLQIATLQARQATALALMEQYRLDK